MPTKWYTAKLSKIEELSSTTKRFFLEVEGDEIVDFTAGQFIVTDLPLGEKRIQRWRSYSLANAPDKSNVLELVIVKLEEGAGSTYFHEQIKIGDTIKFKAPDGSFCLPETIDHDIVMLATGTGVAPFRSMLHDIVNRNISHKKIHLIFGTREEEGILYKEEFEEFEKTIEGFSYSVALSRQEYKGYQGYIHNLYMEKYKEVRKDLHFYICGWSVMIDEAVANIYTKLGYDKSQIHYELYG